MSKNIELVEYNAGVSIAVFGTTSERENALLGANALYNDALRYGDGRRAGWIMSAKDETRLQKAKEIAEKFGMELVEYNTGISVALFGELEEHAKTFFAQKGKFNQRLRYGDQQRPGWFFSIKKLEEVKVAIDQMLAA